MSDEIITTDYGFGVVQINKTNNNDKPEEIGVSNYLLADNNILSRKVKSLEHENKVLKEMIDIIIENYINVTQELIENGIIEGSILTDVGFEIAKKEIYDEARSVAEKEVTEDGE